MTTPTVPLAPPSTPMLMPQRSPDATPDDIADPPVPETLKAALAAEIAADVRDALPTSSREDAVLHAFCARLQTWMQETHSRHLHFVDDTMAAMKRWVETVTTVNEHAQYSLADALKTLADSGIVVLGTPYTAAVSCRTPAGYAVTLTIQKRDMATFLDELSRMQIWLHDHGYTAASAQAAEHDDVHV